MFAVRDLAKKPSRTVGFRLLTVLATIAVSGAVLAADAKKPKKKKPETGSASNLPTQYKPETEIDISGAYHAFVGGENFPSTLDIWGPKAILKIAMDGQDKPMVGMFLKDHLKVVSRYGADNFNLTTMVEAKFDGVSFSGKYSRADTQLGTKIAPIVLTPVWHGGGGGTAVKMPLPRQMSDIPGTYGLALTKDGRTINAQAEFTLDDGTIKVKMGGREYACDYSHKELTPVFWKGNRMDIFKLAPTANGFQGSLMKEVGNKQEQYKVNFVKGRGGGGGHERRWTWVYDAIINNAPPVWIAKLTMHEEEATLVIDINNRMASMKGSLVENILSATGKHGSATVSIRAQKNANGFAGLLRKGRGNAVQTFPIILKNRPARAAAGPVW